MYGDEPYLTEFQLGLFIGIFVGAIAAIIITTIFCYRFTVRMEINAHNKRIKENQKTNDIITGASKKEATSKT